MSSARVWSRIGVLAGVVAGIVISGGASADPPVNPGPPPNIIIFLADDMGMGDTSAYQCLTGNDDTLQIHTPNLEALAAAGTIFTDVHSSSGWCTASRVSLLTGTYPFRSPLKDKDVIFQSSASVLPGHRRTIAHMLREAGYRTYCAGKWHLAVQGQIGGDPIVEGPLQAGFDRFTGLPHNINGPAMIVEDLYMMFSDEPGTLGDLVLYDGADPDQSYAGHENEVQQKVVDAAASYLTDHLAAHSDKPFFLYYPSHANHRNHAFAAPEICWPGTTPVCSDNLSTDVTIGAPLPPPDPAIMIDRARMVRENDLIVGKLLEFLQEEVDPRNSPHKLIDNTLFIFASDHGSDDPGTQHVGSLPLDIADPCDPVPQRFALKGKKGTVNEGGNRIPFIAAWPDVWMAGGISDSMFGLNDLYSTIAEIVGHTLRDDEALDSESMCVALSGASGQQRPTGLIYKHGTRVAFRYDDPNNGDQMKLIMQYDTAFEMPASFDVTLDERYNLSTDIGETADLDNDVHAMVPTLNNLVLQGYSRSTWPTDPSTLTPPENGSNLYNDGVVSDGDFHTTTNWITPYALFGTVPVDDVPGFIFVDGTASQPVNNANVFQGNGTFDFQDDAAAQSALTNGASWVMRGGTLEDSSTDTDFEIDASRLIVKRGLVDLATKNLSLLNGDTKVEMRGGDLDADEVLLDGDAMVEMHGGTLNADQIVIQGGGAGTENIVRFGQGIGGVLTLANATPITFSGEGYIDFASNARGCLVSAWDATTWNSHWDAGRVRIDGEEVGCRPFASNMTVVGSNPYTLKHTGCCVGDLDGDCDTDILDFSIIANNFCSSVPSCTGGDMNGDGSVDVIDYGVWASDFGCMPSQ